MHIKDQISSDVKNIFIMLCLSKLCEKQTTRSANSKKNVQKLQPESSNFSEMRKHFASGHVF